MKHWHRTWSQWCQTDCTQDFASIFRRGNPHACWYTPYLQGRRPITIKVSWAEGSRLTPPPSPCLKYLQQMALQGMSKQKFTPKGICKKRPGVTPFSLKPIIARRQGTLLQNNSTKKKLFPPPEIVKQHMSVIIITIFPTMMANMLLKQKFFWKG